MPVSHHDQIGVRRIGDTAADRLLEPVLHAVEAFPRVRSPVRNGLVVRSTSFVSRLAASESVRASTSVGTPHHVRCKGARRSASRPLPGRHQHLPPM